MNVINATRFYIDKIVGDQNNAGMKVLLLDDATTKTVSMVYSQTQILEKDVYLVERLEQTSRHEAMPHLKAAVFVRPTHANLELLKAEVKNPKFAEYHIYFSNVVPPEMLQQLANADEDEVIRQVQEYFADYVPVNDDLFSINQRHSLRLSTEQRDAATSEMFARNVQGILSALLSLKTQPSAIRFQSTSKVARRVATEVHERIEADGIFHFANRGAGPVLLVLDRADDCATPLLSQWTYQAMVHELLGLNNNRVKLKGAGENADAVEEVVLSCTQDPFFAAERDANFGDLGGAVKKLLDDYQKQTQLNEKISTIEDMQNFMHRYPAFRSQSLNVAKHVALISELSRLVDVCSLMDVSALEQDVTCHDDRSAQWRLLLEKLQARDVKSPDKLRLALLYALRYEGNAQARVDQLKLALDEARLPPEKIAQIDAILKYGGKARRGPGLFASESSLIAKMTKQVKLSLEGCENVYSQHVPLLLETLDALAKGKLKDQHYPTVTGAPPPAAKPSDCLVYVVGGVTYEEASKVTQFNAAKHGLRVVLGGSYIHNSTSFLDDLDDAFGPRAF